MSAPRIRHDLDLMLVADARDQSPALGRVVAWEDGRWRVSVPLDGGEVELAGDRWSDSRVVVLTLLRAAWHGKRSRSERS